MIHIYGMFTPHFLKTVYAAEELGLNYEIKPINLMKGEQKTAEHLQRHPFGKVPVIEHNGQYLFESNAILRYMGSLDVTPAYPSQIAERAHVDQWIEYFAHQAGNWTTRVWFQKCIGPKFFNETPNEQVIKECTDHLMSAMPVIDQHLSENVYLSGERFSLADIVAHTGMMGFQEAGLPLTEFKNFARWFESVESRPSFKRAKAATAKFENN